MRSVTHTTHERGTMVLTLLVTISLVSSALGQMGTLSPKETFASAYLTAAEIAEIITAVEESAYDTPDSWEEELRVRQVDLGNTPGIVVMVKMHIDGTVRVLAVVSPTGKVSRTEVIGGSPVLAEAAEHAIAKWKWAPAPGETKEVIQLKFLPQP